MRKKLTLFAALLVAIAFGFGIKALGWTSSDPSEITDGTYYIYNVGHEQFLHQGNAWGTRASLFPQAYACHVVKNDDGTIKIQPLDGSAWLGDNAYMDASPAVNITAIAVDGGYKLTNGSKALAWDGNEVNWVENAEGANATWQILTAAEMKSGFASVTADKPVDATFMIKGPRLLRANDEYKNSWTNNPAPAIKIENNNAGLTTASCEVWNNTVSSTQEVDLVKGAYKLTVTGFYRFGGRDDAFNAHNNGTEQLNAYIVAGEAKQPLMSICDGKGVNLSSSGNLVNDQTAAGAALLNGTYNNVFYFRVENDGPATVGIKKDVKVSNDWTVFGNYTLTYYGPDATIEDITPDFAGLKAACDAVRAKLGFEVGEHAPYNNAASMKALAEAEAMIGDASLTKAAVDAKIAEVNSLEWVANEHRLDAVYNGDFLLSENDGAPAGWRSTNNTLGGATHARAFVLTDGMTNYAQLAALQPDNTTRGAFFARFDGTFSDRGSQYVYGQGSNAVEAATPYCMPLKAGVAYNFSADMGGWGSTGRNFKIYIVDAVGKTVGEQTIAPTSDCSKVGGTANHFAFEFTPTVDGNCLIYIQCPGGDAGKNCLLSNFSVMVPKSEQTIAWEQEFPGVKEGENIELNATASSELPVSYEFADAEAAAGIATIDGNKLTFTSEGTVVVNAIQEGNDDYLAAEPVSKTITAGANITSLAQLAEIDKTKPFYVGCELTVLYMSELGTGWVYDGANIVMFGVGNATGLVPGAIIAAGWAATYADDPGVLMPASDEAMAVVEGRTGELPAPVETLSGDLAANAYVKVVADLAKVDDWTYTATTENGEVIAISDMFGVIAGENKYEMLGFVYKPETGTPPSDDDAADAPARVEVEVILTVIPVSAVVVKGPADIEGLKAACEAARAKLGFEVGECAPYANIASMEALIEAEALLAEEGELDYDVVAAKIQAINALEWVANEHRMNAIYNGDFRLSANDQAADGWKSTNKTMGGPLTARAFVCNEGDGNYNFLGVLQPEAGTRAALFIRFDGTSSDPGSQYVYGQGTNTAGWSNVPSPYIMPLKAGVKYTCSAVFGNWNSEFGNVKVYVVDAAGETVGQQTATPDSKISQGGTTYKTIDFEFTPTVDGNCSLWIQNPGASVKHNDIITNFVIMRAKNAQAITWEQDFSDITVGSAIELNATASSELPVTYVFADAEAAAGIATIDGNKLTFAKSGSVTVIATQEGNDDWKAAEPVSMVISTGTTITSLAELAEVDKTNTFFVGCELTVVYANEVGLAWVYDGASYAMLLADTEGLEPGTVIAAGWEANYTIQLGGALAPAADVTLPVVADRTGEVPAPAELTDGMAANSYVALVASLEKTGAQTYTATTAVGKTYSIFDKFGVVAGDYEKYDIVGFVFSPNADTYQVIPVKAEEYIPLAEVPADGYYWIKNVETEQYMIHNGYWGTLTTLGDYGMPVQVTTVDGNTTLAYADYIISNDNLYIFKDGANNSQDVQNVYSDNKMNGSNNSNIWTLVPATPTSLYIKNFHNGAYMFANTENEVAYVQTSVVEVENCHWQFVPAPEVAEFVAAQRDAQAAALAQMAGVEAETEAALEGAFAKVTDVTSEVTLPESRGEAYQPGGNGEQGKLDNSKEVLSFSIVAPKAGLYKIVVPAMWRNGSNAATEALANADLDIANTIIYTDDFTGVVLGQSAGASAESYDGAVAITVKGETVYVPNGQDSFEAAVIAGNYGNVVYAYAAEDGATITIKAKTSSGRNQQGQWFVHNAPLTKVYLLEQEEVIEKKDQTIEWNQEFDGIELNQPVTMTATATSGLEVTYALESENDNATIAGSEITFTANCTVVVVASQEGNDEWNAAEPVKKTIVVETDGISSISANDPDALFFNLQGVQIKNPQAGQTYIVVKDNRAFKALVK